MCVLLAYVFLITPDGFYYLSQAATQYSNVSTLAWGKGNRIITYGYDNNGSLTSKVTTEGGTTTETVAYEYNLQNRLKKATTTPYPGSASIVEYKYNPQGIRIEKKTTTASSASRADYVIDSYNHTGYAQVVEETTTTITNPASPVPTQRIQYTIGDDVISQSKFTWNSGTSSWTPQPSQYLLYDGHGNTRQLLNTGLTVFNTLSYDGYGVMLGTTESIAAGAALGTTRLLYSGEYYDSSIKHYNLRARYYNPLNGLFNQMDSYAGNNSDPQSLHKYLYVHNNPVNNIDPSGEFSIVGFSLGTLNLAGIVMTAVSFGFKAYSIGVGFKQLNIISELMLKLSQTSLDPITLLQIRNHIFLLAIAIIGEIAATSLSILKDILYEFAFAIAATALIAAASGLIKGVANGVKIGITKYLNVRKMAEVRRLGQVGEDAAGIIAQKTSIPSLTGTANYRIPDELTTLHLREVKNRNYVRMDNQMKDFLEFSKSKNLEFILDVRAGTGTKLSKEILDMEKAGVITVRRYL